MYTPNCSAFAGAFEVQAATGEMVERSFAWTTRFRRLIRDYERIPETLAGLHFLSFAILLVARFVRLMVESP